jgi:hypothetical protein
LENSVYSLMPGLSKKVNLPYKHFYVKYGRAYPRPK